MNKYLLIAGILAIILGLTHSVLGEVLIFRQLRENGLIPTKQTALLKQRQIRIIWASWHLITVFGFGFAAILFRLAYPSSEQVLIEFIKHSIIVSMTLSSLLVLFATKARHPGWVVLIIIAIVVALA